MKNRCGHLSVLNIGLLALNKRGRKFGKIAVWNFESLEENLEFRVFENGGNV